MNRGSFMPAMGPALWARAHHRAWRYGWPRPWTQRAPIPRDRVISRFLTHRVDVEYYKMLDRTNLGMYP